MRTRITCSFVTLATFRLMIASIVMFQADHCATRAATLYVNASNRSPVMPYMNWGTAATNIQDAVDASNVGDEIVVTNGIYQFGGRVVSGGLKNRVAVTKAMVVRSVNGPEVTAIWGGISAAGSTNVSGTVRCAYLTNGAMMAGFTLTNGTAGGVLCESAGCVISNCVLSGNVTSGPSLDGSAYSGTLVHCTISGNFGNGAYMCALTNCTIMGNFGHGAAHSTLTNCLLSGNGQAGADSCTLNNCTISGNFGGGASGSTLIQCTLFGNYSRDGGGAAQCTLNNCVLQGNFSESEGGGASRSILNNCTVVGNFAYCSGGGVSQSFVTNSIVYYNQAPSEANGVGWAVNRCCTTPWPSSGYGIFTNEPLFVNLASGDLHLQSNSPCIDAGNSNLVSSPTDLDGRPRIVGRNVDLGAYEIQSPASIPYFWLGQYGLPTDGSANFADTDGDGMNNLSEYLAGTNPTNATSVFRVRILDLLPNRVTLVWQSATNRTYVVERSTNLSLQPGFLTLQTNANNKGWPPVIFFADTNPPISGPVFYRVVTQP